jgi:AraC family transcriptional regulator
MDVKLDNVGKMKVAYVELTGPYEEWGQGLMRLISVLQEMKVRISGLPMGLYYDNPLETPPEKLRSEVCVPISGRAKADGRFKVKELPAATVAATIHQGPPEKFTDTFGAMFSWILSNGYEVYGPARETYPRISEDLRPGMGIAIQQPIRKKQ